MPAGFPIDLRSASLYQSEFAKIIRMSICYRLLKKPAINGGTPINNVVFTAGWIRCARAGRVGIPEEIGSFGTLLMGPDGAVITGSDLLHRCLSHRSLLVRCAGAEVAALRPVEPFLSEDRGGSSQRWPGPQPMAAV